MTNDPTLEGLPEEVELSRRLRQFIRMRWVAVVGIVASIACAQIIFGVRFAAEPTLGVAVGVALYNLIFLLWTRRDAQSEAAADTRVQRRRISAHTQIVADLLALTVLLHFTGGIENPFFLFYLIHVGLGSLLLPARDIVWVTALAIGLFAGMVGAEYASWLPHTHITGFIPVEMYRENAFVVAVLVAFATTLGLVSAMATGIVGELRRHRAAQAQARAQELERTREQLTELDRMRTFFLGLASHDLKTPLAVAVNYLQTILDGYAGEVPPKQRQWLERAVIRLEELLQLINDFLDVALLDEQRIAGELEPTGLATVTQLAMGDVAARAKEKGVEIESQVPASLSPVLGSPKRLRRLLVNLLDNGIKFTRRGGQVTLTVTEEAEHIRIDVMDTGVGIPSNDLPHIFEDYFRARQREFIPGAGLGLSTARRIVEAHGGKIWVESPYRADQSGSKFSCYLPRALSPMSGNQVRGATLVGARARQKAISNGNPN